MAIAVIDWQRPWLTHLRDEGRSLAVAPHWRQAATQRAAARSVRTDRGLPVVFVPQEALPSRVGYETHIHDSGEVPTRDNLHDFFNALMWLRFPRIKRQLNQLQATEIQHPAAHRARSGRGRQRDAATLFDENAALFISSRPGRLSALREHQWQALLARTPEEFDQDCAVVLFGHALLEKLVTPYKAITAHVWCLQVAPDWFAHAPEAQLAAIDVGISEAIAAGFASSDFAHLPVLGVPGWWPDQDAEFYQDASVFRPRRRP